MTSGDMLNSPSSQAMIWRDMPDHDLKNRKPFKVESKREREGEE